MYNELSKRQPKSKEINDIKGMNQQINGNLDEIIETSKKINSKPDVNNRHQEQGISNFDTREVNIYDGVKAYTLTLSIAELKNGEKIGYAKKFLRPNNSLTEEIKKDCYAVIKS